MREAVKELLWPTDDGRAEGVTLGSSSCRELGETVGMLVPSGTGCSAPPLFLEELVRGISDPDPKRSLGDRRRKARGKSLSISWFQAEARCTDVSCCRDVVSDRILGSLGMFSICQGERIQYSWRLSKLAFHLFMRKSRFFSQRGLGSESRAGSLPAEILSSSVPTQAPCLSWGCRAGIPGGNNAVHHASGGGGSGSLLPGCIGADRSRKHYKLVCVTQNQQIRLRIRMGNRRERLFCLPVAAFRSGVVF